MALFRSLKRGGNLRSAVVNPTDSIPGSRRLTADELESVRQRTLAALEGEGVSLFEVEALPAEGDRESSASWGAMRAARPVPSHTGGGRWMW